jgi:peptidoglycan/LPS O-acetylase OafA/YrhL
MKNFLTIKLDPKRIFGLDILRAFAILFVVIEHGAFLLPRSLSRITDNFVFDGVSIFFVLSGFLIGGILIKILNKNGFNREILFDFWVRRWFRTMPNYFLILLILCFLNFFFTDDFSWGDVGKYFIFSQNLFTVHPNFFQEAWSLCVEEWFYLLIPVLIGLMSFILKKSYKNGVFFSAIIVIFLVTLYRYFRFSTNTISNFYDWDNLFRKQVITRLDSLMFGVVGAYIYFYYFDFWIKYKKSLFILGILLLLVSKFIIPKYLPVNGLYNSVFSFNLVSISTLFLLPYLSEYKTGKGIFYKPITYISLTSYSIYLLNYSFIQYWIIFKIPWRNFIKNDILVGISKYSLYLISIMILSIIVYKYFEIPITAIRDKKNKR